jgi:FtsP/CotA-like multicopper oxidase with cupredoxin domain
VAAGALLSAALFLLGGSANHADKVQAAGPAGVILRAGYFNAAPDGCSREVWGYSGQLPGPVIRVKEGETVRVKVVNELKVPTSVHWHGMHQRGTWTMDGVEEVSRPPIPPGSAFEYEFKATPAGTHWYHSHVGVQYGNGLFGPLIVEERTPIAAYDREETLFLNDWFLQTGDTLLADLVKKMDMNLPSKMEKKAGEKMEMKDVADIPFQSVLVNGKGRSPGDTKSPLAVVEAKNGEKIRLRLINGSSTYALRFQIDGHPLTVIATDGAPVRPVTVDNLVLGVGERYDVLIEAAGQGTHWIRAVTLNGNEARAILHYAGGPAEPEAAPLRWGERLMTFADLRGRQAVALADKPKEVALRLGGSMRPYGWSINDQFYPKADRSVLPEGRPYRPRKGGRGPLSPAESNRHGPSFPPSWALLLCPGPAWRTESERPCPERHGERTGQKRPGNSMDRDEPWALVLPLPY